MTTTSVVIVWLYTYTKSVFSAQLMHARFHRFAGCLQPASRYSQNRIRLGSFFSVQELVQAIKEFLDENNRQQKPFMHVR